MAKKPSNWKQWKNKQLKDPEIRKAYEDAKIEMDIGIALAEIRKKRKLTQTQVAAILGTSDAQIIRLEKGMANPTLRTLRKIANALGLRLEIRLVPEGRLLRKAG
ncbi:MAG: helix-turn-helix transcriptional regulator [Nitrospirae bacterium]|nr:helix-turn-helix transcriptional regulator [Nitrospirota bacterium]